jgi:succinylglutamate desuccinylase
MLYGTLMEAAVFLKEPEGTLTLYNSRFSEALARLKNLGEAMQTTDFTRYGNVRTQRT